MTRKIPAFKNIKEEAAFWDSHDITDYLDDMELVDVEFAPRKVKSESVTIRIEPELKKRLELVARKNRVSLSTIARLWIIDRLQSGNATHALR